MIFILISSFSFVKAQQSYSFNQLDSLQNIKKKKVLVFLTANWCSYCKVMDEVVFKNPNIAKSLNQHYYFVRLSAEDKRPIFYQNSKFVFNSSLGFHQMAISLVNNNKLIFPATYIINYDNEILYEHTGLINSNNLAKVLNTINDTELTNY